MCKQRPEDNEGKSHTDHLEKHVSGREQTLRTDYDKQDQATMKGSERLQQMSKGEKVVS